MKLYFFLKIHAPKMSSLSHAHTGSLLCRDTSLSSTYECSLSLSRERGEGESSLPTNQKGEKGPGKKKISRHDKNSPLSSSAPKAAPDRSVENISHHPSTAQEVSSSFPTPTPVSPHNPDSGLSEQMALAIPAYPRYVALSDAPLNGLYDDTVISIDIDDDGDDEDDDDASEEGTGSDEKCTSPSGAVDRPAATARARRGRRESGWDDDTTLFVTAEELIVIRSKSGRRLVLLSLSSFPSVYVSSFPWPEEDSA